MPSLEEDVIAFAAEFTGVPRERINLQTTLAGDLGVDGSDGEELIHEFGKRFGVDLSECDLSRHFGPEAGCFPPLFLWQLLKMLFQPGRTPEQHAGLQPITIADLVEAARTKRWTL